MRNAIALVLGGGRGTRLYPLTKYRSKPAVPLAAEYRLIDIPLSNCINSGIEKIYVLTQFLSVSLHRHIAQAFRFDRFRDGFVALLAAQQTANTGSDWYEGTADAVRKNLGNLVRKGIDYVFILSGDQLYRMDFEAMLRTHQQAGADATIAGLPVDREQASGLGLMRVDDSGQVQGFVEKPKTQEEIDLVKMDPAWIDAHGIESRGRDCLASMGIYLFNYSTLMDVLNKTDYSDFGKEIFPASIRARKVHVHLFDGYWEDIGTIRAFFEANLALAQKDPPFSFIAPDAPVYTNSRFLPPTRIEGASVTNSLIADGCIVGAGSVIENCVLGVRSLIGPNVTMRNCVMMGADYYESDSTQGVYGKDSDVSIGVGAGSQIEGSILDKNCRIGANVRIVNEANVQDGPDSETVVIRDGIPVVIKEATIPDGWVLS